jgi:hypothetical protein
MKRKRWIKGPFFVILFLAILSVVSFLTMLLWNSLVPELFNGPVITFWQSMGLIILSKILFGGFRGRGRGHQGHPGMMWKRKWSEKMESMTPEEKEKFRRNCRSFFSEPEAAEEPKKANQ